MVFVANRCFMLLYAISTGHERTSSNRKFEKNTIIRKFPMTRRIEKKNILVLVSKKNFLFITRRSEWVSSVDVLFFDSIKRIVRSRNIRKLKFATFQLEEKYSRWTKFSAPFNQNENLNKFQAFLFRLKNPPSFDVSYLIIKVSIINRWLNNSLLDNGLVRRSKRKILFSSDAKRPWMMNSILNLIKFSTKLKKNSAENFGSENFLLKTFKVFENQRPKKNFNTFSIRDDRSIELHKIVFIFNRKSTSETFLFIWQWFLSKVYRNQTMVKLSQQKWASLFDLFGQNEWMNVRRRFSSLLLMDSSFVSIVKEMKKLKISLFLSRR